MTNRTAGNRYARALLDVAIQERVDLDQIGAQLADVVELFERNPTLSRVMLNPAVPVPRKRAVMIELTNRASLSPILSKLLVLLAGRDRLVLLPDMLAGYRERLLAHQQVVRAEITTAAPLAADRAHAIEAGLARLTGRRVRLQTRVDPAIIGGVVARLGDTIYDGSVTRQLAKIREKLVTSV
jgi:F-type H+-transporting ATPase subunit delta